DAYEGAPTPVTTFMAVVVKVATFALILRVMVEAFPFVSEKWSYMWAILAALSMIVGNFIALRQKNVKRMLAYSSIAHTGYITAALAAPTGMGFAAFIFYTIVYIFMGIGAFAALSSLEKSEGWTNHIDNFKGLAKSNPLVALMVLVFMFSMLGIPPTVGFMGKLGIFLALIGSNIWWLAVVLVVMSIISAGYYLRVVSVMYMYEPLKRFKFEINAVEKTILILMAIIILILGIYPTLFWGFSTNLSSMLIASVGR
ncbi:MAG: NADH-quinone oxidoreductase subunit N, partial [Aquificota bacterium]